MTVATPCIHPGGGRICCQPLVVFKKSQPALVSHDKGEIVLEICEIEEQGMMGLLALHVASKGHCLVSGLVQESFTRVSHTYDERRGKNVLASQTGQ